MSTHVRSTSCQAIFFKTLASFSQGFLAALPAVALSFHFAYAQNDPAADELVGVCYYDIISELCDIPMTQTYGKRLDNYKALIPGQTNESARTAQEICNKFRNQVRGNIAAFCIPEVRKHFFDTLDRLPDN
jgi:hypothetical protein